MSKRRACGYKWHDGGWRYVCTLLKGHANAHLDRNREEALIYENHKVNLKEQG